MLTVSKLITKANTIEKDQLKQTVVFSINFEQIQHSNVVFLLLTLRRLWRLINSEDIKSEKKWFSKFVNSAVDFCDYI